MDRERKKAWRRRRPAWMLAVMMALLFLWMPVLRVEAAETVEAAEMTQTEEVKQETETAETGEAAETASQVQAAEAETAESEEEEESEETAAPAGPAEPADGSEEASGPEAAEAANILEETDAAEAAEAEAEGPEVPAAAAEKTSDGVPEVTIEGGANVDGIYNFGPYNIMSSTFKYWTTPLNVTDSYGNAAKAYCGAALMDGSKNDGRFQNVWRTGDPVVIKCAYYSIGDGAPLAQKIFREGNSDGKGSGDTVRGGEILGHFAMSMLIQDLYPENVPASFRVDLEKWTTSGYRLGSATAHGTTRMNKWFAQAITDYLEAIRGQSVPSGVDVYLCQNNANRQQIYYYLVKKEVPPEPQPEPEIRTQLRTGDGSQEACAEAGITLTDRVTYKNLQAYVGQEVLFRGTLVDRDSGEEIASAQVRRKLEAADGAADVTFSFNASALAGKAAVAFQDVCDSSGKVIVSRRDPKDAEETVTFPKIGTEAHAGDGKGQAKCLLAGPDAVLTDIVRYENLVPGRTYKVRGTLYDKRHGAVITENGKELSAEASLTPSQADGETAVVFRFDASRLAGCELVAFEELSAGGKVVAGHKDPKDPAQTVRVPSVTTTAQDASDGDHTLAPEGQVTVSDRVEYRNLEPGRTYKVTGTLTDGEGNAVLAAGEPLTASREFVPDAPDGAVDLEITLSADEVGEGSYVMFERLCEIDAATGAETVVAVHEDPEDEAQTVTIPEKPEIPEEPPKPHKPPKKDSPKTGDTAPSAPLAAASAGSAAGLAALFLSRRHDRKRNK